MGVCMLPSLFQAISAFCCHKVKTLTLSCPPATMTFALSQAMAIEHVNQRLTEASERLSQNKYFLLKNRFPCVFYQLCKNLTSAYINCLDITSQSDLLKLQPSLSFLAPSIHPYDLVKTCPPADQFGFFSPLLTSVHNMKLSYNSALKIC